MKKFKQILTQGVFSGIFLVLLLPISALSITQNTSKELEFVDAFISDKNIKLKPETVTEVHKTLSNLEKTTLITETLKSQMYVNLTIGYFYARMAYAGTINQITMNITTPDEIWNPIERCEHFFHSALETAKKLSDNCSADMSLCRGIEEVANTYFFAGLGYDFLRTELSSLPGTDTSSLYTKAHNYMAKAIELGTSFKDARKVLAKMKTQRHKSHKSVIPSKAITEISKSFYLKGTFPITLLPTKGEIKSFEDNIQKDENTFTDYKWRFSIKKLDTTWEFKTVSEEKNFNLIIQRQNLKKQEDSKQSILNVIAAELFSEHVGLSLKEIVDRNAASIIEAGYKIEEQKEITLNDRKGFEILAALNYESLGDAVGMNIKLSTKQFIRIFVENGIEYVVSTSAPAQDFDKVFPDLKVMADTFVIH